MPRTNPGHNRKAKSEAVRKSCMCCKKPFYSYGTYHRLCAKCRKEALQSIDDLTCHCKVEDFKLSDTPFV